jgi:hypothetical protein
MSADNQISATITPQNIALFLQKLDEALAVLPALPDISDADLKRLLSIDQSSELDQIAAEALTAHPDWKPFVVDATEYAADAKLFTDTAPMDTKAAATARKVVILRRLAAHDTRRATLAIYNQLAELAARGNTDAQGYYDRMKAHFPRTPKTPKPPTP